MVAQGCKVGGRTKRLAAIVAAAGLIVALGACSSDDDGGDAGDDNAATEQADGTGDDATGDEAGTTDDGGIGKSDELAAAEAELESVNATLTETQGSLDSANSDLATANESNAELTAQLATETARADAAEDTLNNIAAQFPVTISSAITPDNDVTGSYNMSFAEAYCEGAQICGTPPPDVAVQISNGPNGLVLNVPGLFDAGLLGVEGELVAGSDSNTIVTCQGQFITTRVLTTLFGSGTIIQEDGSQSLAGLAASVFVQAAQTDTCPAVSIFYGSVLTPT